MIDVDHNSCVNITTNPLGWRYSSLCWPTCGRAHSPGGGGRCRTGPKGGRNCYRTSEPGGGAQDPREGGAGADGRYAVADGEIDEGGCRLEIYPRD